MPINYQEGIIKEHNHVRKSVGVFDVSHMGQIIIKISDHNTFNLERIIPLNLRNLKLNKSYYSFILNKNGGIIDDIIISKIFYEDYDSFYVVYNASRKSEDEKIFKEKLSEYQFLTNNSLLAVQGPDSSEVLNFLNYNKNLEFMNSSTINFNNQMLILSRSGYTGEDGFEISIPNNVVLKFMNIMLSDNKVKLCGLGSRDSLRLEAGLSLYGNELNEDLTPIDAGLSWALHKNRLNDNVLNGVKILIKQLNEGIKNIKVGIKAKNKTILRSKMLIFDSNQKEIGYISSGGYSPTLESSIGIAYIDKNSFESNKFFCLIRGNMNEIEIVKLPFILHKYKKG